MSLTIEDLLIVPTKDDVEGILLSNAQTIGLDTTAWDPGQPERTILAIMAQAWTDITGTQATAPASLASTLAQGGFLELAANVTPEGGPGWLDLLSQSLYDVTREPATSATTIETITASGATGGTFAIGQLHFTTASGTLFTNTAPVTIPSTGTTTVAIQADIPGSNSSAGAGTINALLTPLIGVTVTNAAAAAGSDAETNAAVVTRCKDRLAALSVDGPQGAYDFNARTINGDQQVQVVSGALTQPTQPATRTRVVTDPSTGNVTTYVANASGAYATPPNYVEQVAQSIVDTTNTSPIQVHVTAHGYVTGDQIFIRGHTINTNANGSWTIAFVDADHFTLTGSTGNGVGGATGTAYRFSDLDLIDLSIQANAVPLAVTADTASAVSTPISVVGTITVTGAAASRTDAQIISAASTALANLAKVLPIGGQGTSGVIFLETIRDAIFTATPGTIGVTLSSPASDVAVAINAVATFTTPSFMVVRV